MRFFRDSFEKLCKVHHRSICGLIDSAFPRSLLVLCSHVLLLFVLAVLDRISRVHFKKASIVI